MATVVFHRRWSKARKAMFVDYKFRGMHTEWAVFWAMARREHTYVKYRKQIFTPNEVDARFAADQFYRKCWSEPMGASDREENFPPKWVFDGLEKST